MDIQTQKTEHRKYRRLHQVFPVKFQYLGENSKPKGEIFEGFTRDVGKGGMSIEVRFAREKGALEFIPGKTKLKLTINIPPDSAPVDSIATVKWSTKISEPVSDIYFLGVEYEQM